MFIDPHNLLLNQAAKQRNKEEDMRS